MRTLSLYVLVLSPLVGLAQQKTEFPALKQRVQRGNYAEARAGYEALIKTEKPPVAAFLGLAAVDRLEGKYHESLDSLDAGLKAYPNDADLLASRADLNYFLGKWTESERDGEAAIKRQDANYLARWVRVRLLRDRGDLKSAEVEVRWFVKRYTASSDAGQEIADAEVLLLIGQAGAENARWNKKPQQFAFILNEVYRDALKADPDCWLAETLAGRLLAEKHNRAEAAEAFDKALKINPKALEALVGKGMLLLEELDSQAASRLADQALKVNPNHPDALQLKADVRLVEGEAASAERLLLAAKLINPRDERTLARLAAIHYLARDPEAFNSDVKNVEGFCKKPGVFFADLAEVLLSRKQYAKAEECFKQALELRPDLAGPRAGLGLLLMQLGREPEARVQLEDAFKADPFHVRVSNALKVLKHLDGYSTTETDHFVVKFDPKTDQVQAAVLADYLEQLHGEFSKLYGYSPPGKLLVEIISSREMFSGRVLSLPGLPGAAQGASTGPLIAIPSPRADGMNKPFNWGVVARHELTHAFNLAQTGYLVPIWLTEGLAVRAEQTRRFDTTLALLRERQAEGTTFDLETISRGYHNFSNPPDVLLAYNQGYRYVQFIAKTYGEAAIPKLLDAYRLGLDTGDAIRRACGVEKSHFEKGYREYLQVLVTGSARPEKPMAFAELEAAHNKKPEDLGLSARLAGEYLRRGKLADAKKLVTSVLDQEKGHPAASLILSRLQLRQKDPVAAIATLETAAKENPEEPRLLMALGRLYLELNEPAKAAARFEALRKLGTPETEVLEILAQLYSMSKNNEPLIGVLTDLAARLPDDLGLHLKLAALHQAAGHVKEAEASAREALLIDILNTEAKAILLAALRAQKKDQEAEKLESLYRP